jgi:signal transduction histidine kinase
VWDETTTALLDLLPVGVLFVDNEGALRRANRPGLSYLGLEWDVVGRPGFPELVSSETLRAALAAPPNGVVRLNLTEGSRTFHAEIRPLLTEREDGKLLLLSDVTAVTNTALLRRNTFFDLLHKLRTPLTTIVSVLSLATSGRIDRSKVDLAEVLGMGATEAERLSNLLGRLKDLFLVESGEFADDLILETVDVNTVLREVLADLRETHEGREHEVRLELPEEPLWARADRELLARTLSMVVENSFHYTPAGGHVLVQAAPLEEQVEIRVEDDGIGIPPDELPHVFECFRRGDSRGLRATEGDGLGLYLARSFLHAQGGTILLDSKPGSGTVVEILLESAEEPA